MATDILVFDIDDRRFGVAADLVVEVVRAVTPLSLPRVPDIVMGIINLRGEVVPVIDIRKSLRLASIEVRHTDHFVIISDGELRYALHTDRAIELTPLLDESNDAKDTLSQPTGRLAKTALGFVQLLHPEDLLSDADRSELASIVSSAPIDERRGK